MKAKAKTSYKDGLVTYIDVLGFRKLLARRKAEAMLRILTTVGEHLASAYKFYDENGKLVGRLRSWVFSDLIVRCRTPVGKLDIRGFVEREANTLARRQASLASEGVFVRGAIFWGRIYIKEGLVFGPALARSYELEQAFAVFPRIVLDVGLLRQIAASDGALPPDDSITQRDDGVAFVDYLFWAFLYCHGFGGVARRRRLRNGNDEWALLSGHKRSIEKAIRSEDARKDEHIRHKYLWLGRYHDWTLDRLYGRLKDSSLADAKRLQIYRLDETILRY